MSERLKKIFILSYLGIVLSTYGALAFHVIALKDTVDFVLFYYASKNFLHHLSIYYATPWKLFHIPHYINSTEVFVQSPIHSLGVNYSFNLNPPALALLTFFFGYMPYQVTASAWYALIVGTGAIAIAILYREFFRSRSVWGYLVLFEIFLTTLPAFANITLGQLGMFTLLGVVGVWIWARQGHECKAGLLLGLILSVKYFLGLICFLFLLQKRWRLVAWAVGVFLILNGLSLIFFGKEAFIQYQEILRHVGWYPNDWNASIYGFFSKLSTHIHQGYFEPTLWVKIATVLCSAVLIFYQARICQKPFLTNKDFDFAFSYTLIISLLIVPLGWVYYLVLMVLPILCVLRTLTQVPIVSLSPILFIYGFMQALLSFPNTFRVVSVTGSRNFALTNSAYFYSLCLLLGLLCYTQKVMAQKSDFINEYEINPWVFLTYFLSAPAFAKLFYDTFFRVPRIWE